MRFLFKTVLILYLLVLLWLVLFKFSFDIPSVLLDHQTRSLNLIPFIDAVRGHARETIDNLIVFIPFGLLLGVNLKQSTLWRKLAYILSFSLAAEIIQYIFAIGRTDITDVIMNGAGGLLGLVLYDLSEKHIDGKRLDQCIAITGMILLLLLVVVRVFVLKVQY